jgi:phosphoribosyl-dephospho-CoA transferase
MPELAAAAAVLSGERPRVPCLARHDLCWLEFDQGASPRAEDILAVDRRCAAAAYDIAAAQKALLAWTGAGHALIVTRQPNGVAPNCHQLALCAPHDAVPWSIAVAVAGERIKRVRPPLLLRDSIHAAPPIWRDSLCTIERALAEQGLEARVFGSLAWQALTGLDYVHATSDLDLIIDLSASAWRAAFTPGGNLSAEFSHWLTVLNGAPFALDCEVRLERDAAFSLAEVRGSSRYVLARCNDRSELIARSTLRELATC